MFSIQQIEKYYTKLQFSTQIDTRYSFLFNILAMYICKAISQDLLANRQGTISILR